MNFRLILCLFVALLVSACGFHLRGDSQLPNNLSPLYIETGQLQPAQLKLVRDMVKKSTAKLSDSQSNSNHLSVKLNPLKRRKIAASSLSDVELVQLSMRIEYSIKTESGKVLVENHQITQTTEVELDSANVLSHEQAINKALLRLQKSLIQSMLFQLSH